jgi:Family of unknown function (DUF6011)
MVNEKELMSNEETAHAAHQISSGLAIKKFVLAGKAIFTVVSKRTGTRYTFKVTHKDASGQWPEKYFVAYLNGPDNWTNYVTFGQISMNGVFSLTNKAKNELHLTMDSAPVAAFNWTYQFVNAGKDPIGVEFWHAGKCGRCGRLLTVPSSIEMGLGPECASKGF